MNDSLTDAARRIFDDADVAPIRRHGPSGYADYRAYKPWLRDEFSFRCIYCLIRERWYPSGHEEFAVEHIQPMFRAPELRTQYENLTYACSSCNRNRRDAELAYDPSKERHGRHLRILADGSVEALSDEGRNLSSICHLNRPRFTEYRRRLLALIDRLVEWGTDETEALLREILSFPNDLPDLVRKRPPGGNSRPEGIRECCFERRKRGELPQVY